MDPTDLMIREHRVIKRVLFCLERMANRSLADGRLDAEAARNAIRFCRNYADRCHHAKEEAVFFPLLEAKGLTQDHSMLGDLVEEHVQGRSHVGAMEAAIDGAAAGEPEALTQFSDHAKDYVRMLRRHIRKEDDFLFPAGELSLDDAEAQSLLERMQALDAAEPARSEIEACLAIADRLGQQFDVAEPGARNGEGG